MIAELGHGALWLAAGMALLQLVALTAGRPAWATVAGPAAMAQAWFLIAAFLALLWCFASVDLSVGLVNDSTHSLEPLTVRLMGVARHAGGQLFLAALVAGFAGGVAAFFGRARLLPFAIAGAVTLVASLIADPFARIAAVPAQGRSLSTGFALPTSMVGRHAVRLNIGQSVKVGPVTVRLLALRAVAGPGYTAVAADLLVLRYGRAITSLHPEHRALIYPPGDASPVALALTDGATLAARVRSTDPTGATVNLAWQPLFF